MKKKIGLLIFLCVVVLSIAGCRKTTSSTKAPTTKTQSTKAPTTKAPSTAPSSTVQGKITFTGVEDITIGKGEQFIPLQGVKAHDAQGVEITNIKYKGNVNPNAVGEYYATYTATDSKGNVETVTRKVTVIIVDVEGPALTGVANTTILVGADFNPLAGVASIDVVDGTITNSIVVTGEVNAFVPGEYVLNYSSKDAAGNETKALRTIVVEVGPFNFVEELTASPFSGGEINETFANYAIVRIKLNVVAAGEVTVAMTNAIGHDKYNFEAGEHVVYVRINGPVTDSTVTVTGAEFVSLSFGSAKDTIAPEVKLNAGNIMDEIIYVPADKTVAEVLLFRDVTANDNIDGNLRNSLKVDWVNVDLNSTEEQMVVIYVLDSSGNKGQITRKVVFTTMIDTKIVGDSEFNDATYQKQWGLNGGSTPETLTLEVKDGALVHTIAGSANPGWDSALSPRLDFLPDGTSVLTTSTLTEGNWYLLKFDVKAQVQRQMTVRIGLSTTEALKWIENFAGASNQSFTITTDWQTNYVLFYVHASNSQGYPTDAEGTKVKMELKIGTFTWGSEEQNNVVSFDNMQIYLLSAGNKAPKLTVNESLPKTFAVGEAAPVIENYVLAFDAEDNKAVALEYNVNAIDMTKVGQYSVTVKATDSQGESSEVVLTFNVIAEKDTEAPVIGSTLPEQVEVGSEFNINDYITITDNVDGNIELLASMVNMGGFNVNELGTYKIIITVKDSSGNEAKFETKVKVYRPQTVEYEVGDKVLDLIQAGPEATNEVENPEIPEYPGAYILSPKAFGWASASQARFDLSGLDFGKAYYLVLTVKAEQARDIKIIMGQNLGVDPWYTYFTDCNNIILNVTEEFVTFKVLFRYDVESVANGPKLEFQVGSVSNGANEVEGNRIIIKDFYVANAVEKTNDVEVLDLLNETVASVESATAEMVDGVGVITVPTIGGWASANKAKLTSIDKLEFGKTYKVKIIVKGSSDRQIAFRVGQGKDGSSDNVWMLDFTTLTAGTIDITQEYAEYEFVFIFDVEKPAGGYGAAMEFQFGLLDGAQNGDVISVKSFKVFEVVEEETEVLDLLNETVGSVEGATAEVVDGVGVITVETIGGWASANKAKLTSIEKLEFGKSYKIVIEVKASSERQVAFRLGQGKDGSVDNVWMLDFTGSQKTISISNEFEIYEFEFKFDVEKPEGGYGAAMEFQFGLLDGAQNGDIIYVKSFKVYEVKGEEVEEPVGPEILLTNVEITGFQQGGSTMAYDETVVNKVQVLSMGTAATQWGRFNIVVPEGMKYVVVKVVGSQELSLGMKLDVNTPTNNKYDGKEGNKQYHSVGAEETTFIWDLEALGMLDDQMQKIVFWPYSQTITTGEFYVTEISFLAEAPVANVTE